MCFEPLSIEKVAATGRRGIYQTSRYIHRQRYKRSDCYTDIVIKKGHRPPRRWAKAPLTLSGGCRSPYRSAYRMMSKMVPGGTALAEPMASSVQNRGSASRVLG